MNPLIQLQKATPIFVIALLLACFVLPHRTQAVSPPPHGGYPGFKTVEGQNTPSINGSPTGVTCTPGWSAGHDLLSAGVRLVGVYFPANGKFYAMGGRASDLAGSDFTRPFEYDPGSNTWTTKSATYPDNQVNNMACGVLNDSGTDYIYCVGGSQAGNYGYRSRLPLQSCHRRDQHGCCSLARWLMRKTLPGGFRVFKNKLYILGGFDTIVGMDRPDLGVYS